jgi:Aminoglycoside-2''-adenylyltransferase
VPMLPTMAEADHQIEAIGRLHRHLTRRALDYWLCGGWAVDFHAGRVTRRHADIDVAVWQADFERIDGVLGEDGWTRRAQPGEDGYTEYGNGVHHVDLAFLVRDDEVGRRVHPACRGSWRLAHRLLRP